MLSTSASRATFADFMQLQLASCDSERPVQLCIVDHSNSNHVHVQVHFSNGRHSPWHQVTNVCLQDVRETLRLSFPNIRIHLHGEEQRPPNPPAAASFVDALPKATLCAAAATMMMTDGGDESCCNICLEEFGVGDVLACMPCKGMHKFHKHCLARWLSSASTCPCCQWRVPRTMTTAELKALLAPAKAECLRLAAAQPPPCQLVDQGPKPAPRPKGSKLLPKVQTPQWQSGPRERRAQAAAVGPATTRRGWMGFYRPTRRQPAET